MWDQIGIGWKSAFGAIRQNPPFFLCFFVILLVVETFLQPRFPVGHLIHHHYERAAPSPIPLNLFFLYLAQTIFSSAIVAPCMVAVHRSILLNETGTALSNRKLLCVFTLWLIAIHSLPAFLEFISARVPGAIFLGLVSYYLIIRLVLSFPAIAIGSPSPLKESWKLSKGHWWQIFWTMFLGLAPTVLAVLPSAFTQVIFVRVIIASAFGMFLPIIAAALASGLYLKFRDSISLILPNSDVVLHY